MGEGRSRGGGSFMRGRGGKGDLEALGGLEGGGGKEVRSRGRREGGRGRAFEGGEIFIEGRGNESEGSNVEGDVTQQHLYILSRQD